MACYLIVVRSEYVFELMPPIYLSSRVTCRQVGPCRCASAIVNSYRTFAALHTERRANIQSRVLWKAFLFNTELPEKQILSQDNAPPLLVFSGCLECTNCMQLCPCGAVLSVVVLSSVQWAFADY